MTRTTLGIVAATITAVLALAGCGSSQQPEHQSGMATITMSPCRPVTGQYAGIARMCRRGKR